MHTCLGELLNFCRTKSCTVNMFRILWDRAKVIWKLTRIWSLVVCIVGIFSWSRILSENWCWQMGIFNNSFGEMILFYWGVGFLQRIQKAWSINEKHRPLNNSCLFPSYCKCLERTKLPFMLNSLLTKDCFASFPRPFPMGLRVHLNIFLKNSQMFTRYYRILLSTFISLCLWDKQNKKKRRREGEKHGTANVWLLCLKHCHSKQSNMCFLGLCVSFFNLGCFKICLLTYISTFHTPKVIKAEHITKANIFVYSVKQCKHTVIWPISIDSVWNPVVKS